MDKEEILEMLHECRLQLEYLNNNFEKGRGTTNTVMSRLETLIQKLETPKVKKEKPKFVGRFLRVKDFPQEVKEELYSRYENDFEPSLLDKDKEDWLEDYVSDDIYMERTNGIDNSYLYYRGSIKLPSFEIRRDGSEYIEDGGICDMEYDDYEIYNLK